MIRNHTWFILIIIIFFSVNSDFAQDISLGSSGNDASSRGGGGYFNYSDPQTINIKVSVWGYVQYPGRYQIPIYTTPADLLSYAGGPLEGSELDDVRIYRVREDGSEEFIKLDYYDVLHDSQLKSKNRTSVTLKAGDFLIIPGGPQYYFRDWLGISLSILSTLISLAILFLK